MRRPWKTDESTSNVTADLFAGLLVALLIIMIFFLLQTMREAYEIQRLKKIKTELRKNVNNIVSGEMKDLLILNADGQIQVLEQEVFKVNRWRLSFEKNSQKQQNFISIRSGLAGLLQDLNKTDGGINKLLENIQADRKEGERIEIKDLIEIHVIGHTDCATAKPPCSGCAFEDNFELSSRRATSLARFLTAHCDDVEDKSDPSSYECCPEDQLSCKDEDKNKRINPYYWQVLPIGRGLYAPEDYTDKRKPKEFDEKIKKQYWGGALSCKELGEKDEVKYHDNQRRVMIQLVFRFDKLLQDE